MKFSVENIERAGVECLSLMVRVVREIQRLGPGHVTLAVRVHHFTPDGKANIFTYPWEGDVGADETR